VTRAMPQGGAPPVPSPVPGIHHAIAVASGKGGVGKTTVAVNVAISLAKTGVRVGLLDADVYGPNVPKMMGVEDEPVAQDQRILPVEAGGLKLMSLGFMLEEGTPVIWRGPMIAGALKQLIQEVAWGELDYLIMDLPPGTGDAALSLAQLIPLTGAVIVSTPQEVALQDVRRSISMFQRLTVPVLGIVENMSYYVHPGTNDRVEMFGHGGARRMAEELGLGFLGEVPLDPGIGRGGDSGNPVAADEDSPLAEVFDGIALRLTEAVAELERQDEEDDLPML